MNIIIFGGAGFIGSALVKNLLAKGHQVAFADNLVTGKKDNLPIDVPFYDVDITINSEFDKVSFRPDLIINLAFPTSLCDRRPENQYTDVAALGMLNVLEYTRSTCNRIVYGSSISVYGEATDNPITEDSKINPSLIYGAGKYLGELYTKIYHSQHGTDFNIIRISDTFGERDLRKNAINNFISSFLFDTDLAINGDGEQMRTYTYVEDMAEAIALASMDLKNDVYNVAAAEAISINTLLAKLNKLFGKEREAMRFPEKIDIRNYVFDCTKFLDEFGEFEKIGIDAGLEKTADYIRSITGR